MSTYRRPPNLFWPILLIGVGVLLLLANLNIIERIQLGYLVRLWPLILVALGIEVLFGRNNAWMGNVLSAGLVVAALVFLIYAPKLDLGITPTGDYVTETFFSQAGLATSANINMDIDEGNLVVGVLEDSTNLIEIEAFHNQEVNFRESGSRSKTVDFDLQSIELLNFTNLFDAERIKITADVTNQLPVALDIDTGSSSTNLYLEGLQLLEVSTDTGSGRIAAWLPAGEYPVDFGTGSGSITVEAVSDCVLELTAETGSGNITLMLGENVSGTVELDSGSGNLVLEVPEGTGVQITGETGSGKVSLPAGYIRTKGGDRFGGTEGTWQSPGFAGAQLKLYVEFNVGSGSLRVVEK